MTPTFILTASVLLFLASTHVESAPCVPFTEVLTTAGYPEDVQAEVQGLLKPFFEGVMFLPNYAKLKAYQAAHPGASLQDLVFHHSVPFLSATDPSAATGLLVRTMLDLVDNPTLCPAGQTTLATVTFSTAGGATKVNGVPTTSPALDVCDVGAVFVLGGVADPTCVPTPPNVKKALVKPPPKKKKVDKCATAKTVLQVLSTLGGGAKLLAKTLPEKFTGTIFVPTDTAITALSQDPAFAFLSKDPKEWEDIVLYHAIPKVLLSPDSPLPTGGLVTTLLADSKKQSLCKGGADGKLQVAGVTGQPLTVTAKANSNTQQSPVAVQSIPACNGVVYMIDSVLLPCPTVSMIPATKPKPKKSPPRKMLKSPPVKKQPPPSPKAAAPTPAPVATTTVPATPVTTSRATDPATPSTSNPAPSQVAKSAAVRGVSGGVGWTVMMTALALLCATLFSV